MTLLQPGRWHLCASWNMEAGRARWIGSAALTTKVQEALRGVGGVTFRAMPTPDALNPMVQRTPLTVVARDVWSVDVWIDLAAAKDSSVFATAFCTALRNAGAGADWSIPEIAASMEACAAPPGGAASAATGTAVTLLLGPFAQFTRRTREAEAGRPFEAVCLTAEAFSDRVPPIAGVDSALGRAAAGPVADSNQPNRIGARTPIFTIPGINFPFTGTELKITLGIVGGLVGLVVVGYAARGVAQLFREA